MEASLIAFFVLASGTSAGSPHETLNISANFLIGVVVVLYICCGLTTTKLANICWRLDGGQRFFTFLFWFFVLPSVLTDNAENK